MTFREFLVPSDDEILDTFGVDVEPIDDFIRGFTLDDPEHDGGTLAFSYDVPGRSVRCRWTRGDKVLLDVFREGATRLTVWWRSGTGGIDVTIETDSLEGRFAVTLEEGISITDSLLLV